MLTDLTQAECATLAGGRCPDCGGAGFRMGPRGGGSQNVECMTCRQGFNVATFGWSVVMGQRLGREEAERRARSAFRDDGREPRACDRCGGTYRGPGVYCSMECAEADA